MSDLKSANNPPLLPNTNNKLDKLRTMIIEHDQSYASLDEIMATVAQLIEEEHTKAFASGYNEAYEAGRKQSAQLLLEAKKETLEELLRPDNLEYIVKSAGGVTKEGNNNFFVRASKIRDQLAELKSLKEQL